MTKDDYILTLQEKIKLMGDLLNTKDSVIELYKEALTDIGAKLEYEQSTMEPAVDRVWTKNHLCLQSVPVNVVHILYDQRFAWRGDIEQRLEIIDKTLNITGAEGDCDESR